MDRQQFGICIGDIGEEARAAIGGLIRVPAEHGGPGRPVDLQRVMHQIARDHGMLAAAFDMHAAMARRVALFVAYGGLAGQCLCCCGLCSFTFSDAECAKILFGLYNFGNIARYGSTSFNFFQLSNNSIFYFYNIISM